MVKKEKKSKFVIFWEWSSENLLSPFVRTIIFTSTSLGIRYLLEKYFNVGILEKWLEVKEKEEVK